MVNYKLIYFNGAGRAEVARLQFVLSGTKFEDVRIEQEDWPAHKPKTLYSQVPELEVDGVKLCQSNAINRYLAKQFGFHGKNPLDEARVDMIVYCLEDMIQPTMAFFGDDKAAIEKLQKVYKEQTFLTHVERLEKLLVSNNGGDGYFVGDTLTWADLAFTHYISFPNYFDIQADFSNAPHLKALKEKVEAIPKLAEYLKSRPKTAF